jgi:hypothetical protein
MAEKNGEISGVPCNVFDLSAGKEFVLVVKKIQTGDETYPDYKASMFRGETTSLPIFKGGVFKNAPLENGKIAPNVQGVVKNFLLERTVELEDFAPKKLSEEQQVKITEISNFLTGKASSSFSSAKAESKPSSDDFSFEENFSEKTPATSTASADEDDFFADI